MLSGINAFQMKIIQPDPCYHPALPIIFVLFPCLAALNRCILKQTGFSDHCLTCNNDVTFSALFLHSPTYGLYQPL